MAIQSDIAGNLERGDLELRAGALELGLAASGGIVTHFHYRPASGSPRPILRPALARVRDPRESSCFPLVPFSNRIRHATFRFGGQSYRLPANNPPEPHSLHGFGWTASWEEAEMGIDKNEAHIVLVHDGPPGADSWPSTYRCWQSFRLTANGLTITITLRNQGPRPMPAGLGLHPYFPCPPTTRATFTGSGLWAPDAEGVADRQQALPADWDFNRGPALTELNLDHHVSGWNGAARLAWPDGSAVELAATGAFRHLVLFSPKQADFACLEPVSHIADGANRTGTDPASGGIDRLEPGEYLAGQLHLRPRL